MGILEGILFSIALAGVTGWGFFMLFQPLEVRYVGMDRSSWLLIGGACLVFLIGIAPANAQSYWYGSVNVPSHLTGNCHSAAYPVDNANLRYVGPIFQALEECAAPYVQGFLPIHGCGGSGYRARGWTGEIYNTGDGDRWSSSECCIKQATWKFQDETDHTRVQPGQIGVVFEIVAGHATGESCPEFGETGQTQVTIFNHNCSSGQEMEQFFPGRVQQGLPVCMGGCEWTTGPQDDIGNVTMSSEGDTCKPQQRPDGSTCHDATGQFDAECWCELNPTLCRDGEAESGNACESRPPTRLVYHECPAQADTEGKLECTDSDYSQSNWPTPGGTDSNEVCYNNCTYITDGGYGEGGVLSDDLQLWAVGNPWEKGQWSATYETTIRDEAGNVIWTAPECEGGDDADARDPSGGELGEGDSDPGGGESGTCDPAVEECGAGSGSGGGGSASSGSAGSGVDTGQCNVAPACGSASSIECALLRQQWRTMCELREGGGGGDGDGGWENDLADVEGDRVENDPELAGEDFFVEKDVIESFDDSGFLSSATCPDLGEFQIAGQTYTFEGQTLCDVLSTVGFLVLASAALGGALIVLRA